MTLWSCPDIQFAATSEKQTQTTPMSCPDSQHNTKSKNNLADDTYVVPGLLTLKLFSSYLHMTTMSSPAQLTKFNYFPAAHDLMSCPMENNTASSSSKQSV